jgi:hypothetical protein
MPKEQINDTNTSDQKQFEISWNKLGWVQASIHEQVWDHTGEWSIADLTPSEIDKLVKVLKKAKRQAYGEGRRHYGFADAGAPITVKVDGRPLTIVTGKDQMTTTDQILMASGLTPAHYDLGRISDGRMHRQTKDNPYIVEGGEDYISIRISTM